MTQLDHPPPAFPRPTQACRVFRTGDKRQVAATRTVINETAVAIVLNGTTVAVMMASPLDIQDFAYGFAVTEGYIVGTGDIEDFKVVAHPNGLEARFWVTDPCADALKERRRAMLGPIGCGLCGIESLDAAIRHVKPVSAEFSLSQLALTDAFETLKSHQHLHNATRSCHAAGFVTSEDGLLTVREDVGRHNALDKLIGSLLGAGTPPSQGAIIMTSRISVELVQKAAIVGCGVLCGVSGPSALAVDTARQADITLIGFHRGASCDLFSGERRVSNR